MAAMKRGTTSGELKAFIRSNIQQILNGANNNLMEEKDGIDYLCATIDGLLDIINRMTLSTIDDLKSSCQNKLSRTTLIMIFREYEVKYWTQLKISGVRRC